MVAGMEKLKAWFARQGHGSKQELAFTLGVTRVTVSRWLSGERKPMPRMMTRIREATGGAVPEAAWFEDVA